jgi:hypothetical protein
MMPGTRIAGEGELAGEGEIAGRAAARGLDGGLAWRE